MSAGSPVIWKIAGGHRPLRQVLLRERAFSIQNKGQQLRWNGRAGRRIARHAPGCRRRRVRQWRQYDSLAAKESDVLFSIEHISDGRAHTSTQCGLNVE